MCGAGVGAMVRRCCSRWRLMVGSWQVGWLMGVERSVGWALERQRGRAADASRCGNACLRRAALIAAAPPPATRRTLGLGSVLLVRELLSRPGPGLRSLGKGATLQAWALAPFLPHSSLALSSRASILSPPYHMDAWYLTVSSWCLPWSTPYHGSSAVAWRLPI